MFDIGFAELIIIGVVALIVIGPERLPGAVRTGAAWLTRIRRGFNEIKNEVQQELHNDEIMRELRESRDQLRQETDSLRRDLSNPLADTEEAIKAGLNMGPVDSTPDAVERGAPSAEPKRADD